MPRFNLRPRTWAKFNGREPRNCLECGKRFVPEPTHPDPSTVAFHHYDCWKAFSEREKIKIAEYRIERDDKYRERDLKEIDRQGRRYIYKDLSKDEQFDLIQEHWREVYRSEKKLIEGIDKPPVKKCKNFGCNLREFSEGECWDHFTCRVPKDTPAGDYMYELRKNGIIISRHYNLDRAYGRYLKELNKAEESYADYQNLNMVIIKISTGEPADLSNVSKRIVRKRKKLK